MLSLFTIFLFFFFNDTATTEIYTLSLHDALPICRLSRGLLTPVEHQSRGLHVARDACCRFRSDPPSLHASPHRSEEHTSELQSQSNLVCRLLLEKKKT